jgi:hypothetical protein
MAIIRKYWGYSGEVSHVTFRKSKASENLGVFLGVVRVYAGVLFDLL